MSTENEIFAKVPASSLYIYRELLAKELEEVDSTLSEIEDLEDLEADDLSDECCGYEPCDINIEIKDDCCGCCR